MAEHTITLTLPDALYTQAQRIADELNLPLENVVLQMLYSTRPNAPTTVTNAFLSLPEDDRTVLTALRYLSEATLRGIVRDQMPQPQQARLVVLMERNNYGLLTPEEELEFNALVEDGQQRMLRKARAAQILTERGFDISLDDFA